MAARGTRQGSRLATALAAGLALALATLICGAVLALAAPPTPDPSDWSAIRQKAKGETVYWHAWAGSQAVNDYIGWAAAEMRRRHGVDVVHVKLADTSEAVARILAEKQAGRDADGAVDLIWINGPNFASLKEKRLLFGPFAEALPNWRYADVEAKGLLYDFTVPTDGFEAPWGMAQLVFYGEAKALAPQPRSARELLAWAKAHRGRFAYPDPANFLGTAFLEQVLLELAEEPARVAEPVTTDAEFERVARPLFAYLDELEPNLWRQGRAYPASGSALRTLMADGEIDLALSFNPAEASTAIARGELPVSVRSFIFDKGTLGNASFLAIPYNATHKAGALLLADFLLSPEAQAKKQDPGGYGGFTVLAMAKLSPEDRARFEALPRGAATLSAEELGRTLPEPHPTWTKRLTAAWKQRYGVR